MLHPTLPASGERSWHVSFWLAASLSSGLLLAVAARLAGFGAWVVVGALVAMGLAISGIFTADFVGFLYSLWNRMVRAYCRMAHAALTWILFYTVFLAVRRAGSQLRFERRRHSLWLPRATLPAEAYGSEGRFPLDVKGGGWIRRMIAWSVRSGHLWVLWILPFLLMLVVVTVDDESPQTPADIYTLY